MIKKNKKGFTLVELLVVIAIIGILASIGIVAISGARIKARDAKRVSDLTQIASALELYYADQAAYPLGGIALDPLTLGIDVDEEQCNANACDTISLINGISDVAAGTVYMGLIPKDPSTKAGSPDCAVGAKAICNYAYTAIPIGCDNTEINCTGYKIWAYIEGVIGGFEGPSAICRNQNGISTVACP